MNDKDIIRTSVAMKKPFHAKAMKYVKDKSLGFESFSEFIRTCVRNYMESTPLSEDQNN